MMKFLTRNKKLLPTSIQLYTSKLCSTRVHVTNKTNSEKAFNSEYNVKQRQRIFEHEKKINQKIDVTAYALLLIPITTFGLGIWQIKRKMWKDDLIQKLKTRTSLEPIPLPNKIENIDDLEYRPVRVKGRFLHHKEIHFGPRAVILDHFKDKRELIPSWLLDQGYLIVTPFEESGTKRRILVNRGFLPRNQAKDPERITRESFDEIEIVGIVRKSEAGNVIGLNKPEYDMWIYRDIELMAKHAGTEPIYIDAAASTTVPGGPVGGQTRIFLRDAHLSYIFTWFGLSAATGFMWWQRFLRGRI